MALGGGAVLREENRRAIRAAGPVVWLTASVDTILERLAADPATASRRPNLTTAGGRAEIEALLATRTPIYRECATLVVDTEGKTRGRSGGEIARGYEFSTGRASGTQWQAGATVLWHGMDSEWHCSRFD